MVNRRVEMNVIKINLPYINTENDVETKELFVADSETGLTPSYETVLGAINERIKFSTAHPGALRLERDDWLSAKFIFTSAKKSWYRKVLTANSDTAFIKFSDSIVGATCAVMILIPVYEVK